MRSVISLVSGCAAGQGVAVTAAARFRTLYTVARPTENASMRSAMV